MKTKMFPTLLEYLMVLQLAVTLCTCVEDKSVLQLVAPITIFTTVKPHPSQIPSPSPLAKPVILTQVPEKTIDLSKPIHTVLTPKPSVQETVVVLAPPPLARNQLPRVDKQGSIWDSLKSSSMENLIRSIDLDSVMNQYVSDTMKDLPIGDVSIYSADLIKNMLNQKATASQSDLSALTKNMPNIDFAAIMGTFTSNIAKNFLNGIFGKGTRDKDAMAVLNTVSGVLSDAVVRDEILKQLGVKPKFFNQCKKDILRLYEKRNEKWVWKILDSFGKPGSGILQGATVFYGSYRQCVEMESPPDGFKVFKLKYCLMAWQADTLDFGKHLSTAICVPDTCASKDIIEIYPIVKAIAKAKLPQLSNLIEDSQFLLATCINGTKSESTSWKPFTWVLGTIITVIFICTVLDRFVIHVPDNNDNRKMTSLLPEVNYANQLNSAIAEKENIYRNLRTKNRLPLSFRVVHCFSAYRNVSSVLNTDVTDPNLACFHGIRCLCLSWVVMGHVFMNFLVVLENVEYTSVKAKSLLAGNFITQGFYAVDTFFVLSGFLVTYIYLKFGSGYRGSCLKKWTTFYLHRYIRLTPSFVVLRWWAQTQWMELSEGPVWMSLAAQINKCASTWNWSLSYLSNFNDDAHKCLSWTWYLANDFQFYAISPLFLIPLNKYPKPTLIVMGVLIGFSGIYTAVINYKNGFLMMLNYIEKYAHDGPSTTEEMGAMNRLLYEKPYCRVGPYLIGMILGFAYSRNRKYNFNKKIQTILWMASITSMVNIIFGIHGTEITLRVATVYNGFGRVAWALAISWPIYACVTGDGEWTMSIFNFGYGEKPDQYVLVAISYGQFFFSNSTYTHNQIVLFWSWLFVASKAVELMDTAFLVAKKQKLNIIHWFHHAATLCICWAIFQEVPAMSRYMSVINYSIHTVMYSYFALRALRFSIPRGFAMFITTSQIFQMAFGLALAVYSAIDLILGGDCQNTPRSLKGIFFGYGTFFALFVNFFVKSYVSGDKTKKVL